VAQRSFEHSLGSDALKEDHGEFGLGPWPPGGSYIEATPILCRGPSGLTGGLRSVAIHPMQLGRLAEEERGAC
jgi:hypothetical protein